MGIAPGSCWLMQDNAGSAECWLAGIEGSVLHVQYRCSFTFAEAAQPVQAAPTGPVLRITAVQPAATAAPLQNVASISAGNDDAIGEMIADALDKVGSNGVLSIETSNSTETFVEVQEGMEIDRGYVSPQFVTNQERLLVEFDNCKVLITDQKVRSTATAVPAGRVQCPGSNSAATMQRCSADAKMPVPHAAPSQPAHMRSQQPCYRQACECQAIRASC
jgi:hypothetical protein